MRGIDAGKAGMTDRTAPGTAVRNEARDFVLALLAARVPEATICPSEVARALAAAAAPAADWRAMMPAVHAAVDRLVTEESVRLSWKGQTLDTRAGPYRIARGARS